jgi:hypothetical protein
MKPNITRLLLAVALAAFHPSSRADDITVNNLTIQQSAFFGSVFTDNAATMSSEGLRIDTAQDVAETYHTSTIPGYNQDNWVTVEDYGYVEYGHWETPQMWDIVGQEWIPPVLDENGIEIAPGYYQSVYGWVSTGSPYWVSDGSTWGVIGTHQENQPVWVPEQTNSWTETVVGVPRVRFNATRSDTNFVFRVPGNGPEGMKDVFVVWEGGVSVPNADPSRMTVLQADAIQHTFMEAAGSTTTRTTAEVMTQSSSVAYTEGASVHQDTSESELRPALLKFTRTENVDGNTSVAQTQIAAKSASFAGVVDVNGNLKVKGAVLIAPQGDLLMGTYTNGPQP